MLNFEPHKPTYKISIEVGCRSVGRSVVQSFIARIQPMIIRLTLKRSAIILYMPIHMVSPLTAMVLTTWFTII